MVKFNEIAKPIIFIKLIKTKQKFLICFSIYGFHFGVEFPFIFFWIMFARVNGFSVAWRDFQIIRNSIFFLSMHESEKLIKKLDVFQTYSAQLIFTVSLRIACLLDLLSGKWVIDVWKRFPVC